MKVYRASIFVDFEAEDYDKAYEVIAKINEAFYKVWPEKVVDSYTGDMFVLKKTV